MGAVLAEVVAGVAAEIVGGVPAEAVAGVPAEGHAHVVVGGGVGDGLEAVDGDGDHLERVRRGGRGATLARGPTGV